MERKTSDELCPDCGRFIEYIYPSAQIGWIKSRCVCVKEKHEEELKKATVKAREHIRTLCGIPKMFLDKTFDNYIPRNDDEKKLKQWTVEFSEKKFDNTGIWLIMLGDCGVGKTHISTAIMNKTVDTMEISEQVAKGFINGYTDNVALPCRYVRCTDLIENELYRMKSNSGTDYEAICKYTPLLVLDDFGVTKATDWNRELFYRILDYRYINELPTVLSTNMTADELKEALGKRSYDRLKDMCKNPLAVNGESFRGKEKA